MTGYVIGYLRAHGGEAIVKEVLEEAGEARSADELADDRTWSSYEQFRRLLEATAKVLGGPERLADVTREALSTTMATPEFTEVLQALGSPSALFESIVQAAASLTTVIGVEAEMATPTEWVLRQRFADGWTPFREFCHYSIGLYGVVPQLFGFSSAEVVEEKCQCRGASACQLRIRWEETEDPVRRAEYFELRSQVVEARLEALQDTVADLVSDEELEVVLRRIVASAARAVQAPSYVLAIEEGLLPSAAPHVYAEGLDEEE